MPHSARAHARASLRTCLRGPGPAAKLLHLQAQLARRPRAPGARQPEGPAAVKQRRLASGHWAHAPATRVNLKLGLLTTPGGAGYAVRPSPSGPTGPPDSVDLQTAINNPVLGRLGIHESTGSIAVMGVLNR